MEKETLIEQYLKVITGQEYDVEIIDGVVDIIKQGFWHIYIGDTILLSDDHFVMIGAFTDDEITISDLIRKHQQQIRDIVRK